MANLSLQILLLLSFAVVADLFLRVALGALHVPTLPIYSVILSLTLFWAITRYRFLSLGIAEASRDLFTHVGSGVLLVSPEGSVTQ